MASGFFFIIIVLGSKNHPPRLTYRPGDRIISGMSRLKKIVMFAAWVGLWLVICAGLLELAARAQLLRVTTTMWEVRYEFDWQTLFRIKPSCHPDIGPYGNRLTPGTRTGKPAHLIAVQGDSFAYGVNVSTTDNIAAELERRLGPGYGVMNFGVAGYGPDQSFLQLKRTVLKLKPETVVLTLFPANDFADLAKNKLFTVGVDGQLAPNRANVLLERIPTWRSTFALRSIYDDFRRRNDKFYKSRYDKLYRFLLSDTCDVDLPLNGKSQPSQAKLSLMRAVLREYRDTLKSSKIPLHVAIIPSYESIVTPEYFTQKGVKDAAVFANEAWAALICREEGINFVDLTPRFRAWPQPNMLFAAERHLSPRGYAEVAGAFFEMMQREK